MSKKLILALFLGTLTSTALADEPAPTVEHDFLDADEVVGNLHTTQHVLVDVRRPGLRRSLINPRWGFVPELLKSVEVM